MEAGYNDGIVAPSSEKGAMVSYKLTRSSRKTLAIYVRDGYVDVRAPLRMPKADIDRFVLSKEKWISEKLAKSTEQLARRESFALSYGDSVIYRGKEYPITQRQGDLVGFDDASFYIPPGLSCEEIKYACIQIYKLLAKRDLTTKTYELSKRMSVAPYNVRINSAKSRWGSCSTKKSLNYSWRLIMADDEVIDYVVAHELAHITEPNHSPRFWALVEAVFPDYNERKAKLVELQTRLGAEDWE